MVRAEKDGQEERKGREEKEVVGFAYPVIVQGRECLPSQLNCSPLTAISLVKTDALSEKKKKVNNLSFVISSSGEKKQVRQFPVLKLFYVHYRYSSE